VNGIIRMLCILVTCEMVVATAVITRWSLSPHSGPGLQPPRPDLAFLDSVTAQEIRDRQKQVTSDRADDWRSLAEIYVLYGFFNEASICCRRAAALDPEAFWTYLWWGTALSRLGITSESTEKFLAGIPYAEDSLADVSWYCIGLNLLREENPHDAENAFRTSPGYAPADYELAKLLVRSDRVFEAVPILNRLIEDHPETEKYYQLRARSARLLGNWDLSADFEDQADRATQVLSSDELTGFLEEQIGRHGLDVLIHDSRELLRSRSVAAAAARLGNVLSVEWRHDAADLLVHAELELDHPDQALRILNKTLVRSGPTPQRLVALGEVHHRQGNHDRARDLWIRASHLRLHQPAHERLSEYYERNGNEQEASRHQAFALLAAGIAAERTDHLHSAAEMLEQAVAINPLLSHGWFHLGECHRLLNESGPAEQAYRRCLMIEPYHGRARRSLDRVIASH